MESAGRSIAFHVREFAILGRSFHDVDTEWPTSAHVRCLPPIIAG
jgi:hypothetical protein